MSDLEKWAIEQAKLYGLLDEYLECRLRGYSILADLAEHQATGHALGRHTRAEALTGTHIVNIFHNLQANNLPHSRPLASNFGSM